MLSKGNVAVMKELSRLDIQGKTLTESHLKSKVVLSSFTKDLEEDRLMIEQFEETNKMMCDRIQEEHSHIAELKQLVTTLKRSLLQVSKDRDNLSKQVQITKKQLDKHQMNLSFKLRDNDFTVNQMESQMKQAMQQS